MEKTLTCIACGDPRDKGRKLCRNCYLRQKREKEREKNKTQGRYNYGKSNCEKCGKEITLWRKTQKLCSDCAHFHFTTGRMLNSKRYVTKGTGREVFEHRVVVEQALGRKLKFNEVIHHLDNDGRNNAPDNLIVLSRSKHTLLHSVINRTANINNIKNFAIQWLTANKIKFIRISGGIAELA